MTEPVKAGKAGPIAAVIILASATVMYFEGYVPSTYKDPIGILTACYGHTGPELQIGQRYTKAQCEAYLQDDLQEAHSIVLRCITRPIKEYEAAALISAAYNIGPKVVCGSTLQRKANAGQPFCQELDKWVYAGGKKLNGLVKRRAAERKLCEGNA